MHPCKEVCLGQSKPLLLPLPSKIVPVYRLGTLVCMEAHGTCRDDARHVARTGKNRLNSGVSASKAFVPCIYAYEKVVHGLKIARCGPWSALGGLEYPAPLKDLLAAFLAAGQFPRPCVHGLHNMEPRSCLPALFLKMALPWKRVVKEKRTCERSEFNS